MSFSRLPYDSCAYSTEIKQSTDIGKYSYNAPTNCNRSFIRSPYIRNQNRGGAICSDKPLIDVDSELLGLNVKRTKCPSKDYDPTKQFCTIQEEKDNDTEINSFFNVEPTRISNPPCGLKGYTANRFEWLPCNPQDKVFNLLPFERLANTMIMAKDNHRACIPVVKDNDPSLPTPIEPFIAAPDVQEYHNKDLNIENDIGFKFKNFPTLEQHNNLRSCDEIPYL